MHSPETLAFEIYLGRKKKKNGHYRTPLISIWHNDPEKDGTDDSCGWFMRSRHGNADVKEKIKKAIEHNFDSTFTSDESKITYNTGYFRLDGIPNHSTIAITLNMFYRAAYVFFGDKREKANKWMQNNLFDIIHFAENPVDSLRDDIEGTFRIPCGEKWNKESALNNYTSIIYGWLLRKNRKWYQHPRWHVHHWSIQIHPLQQLKRRFWDKCSICHKRGFKEGAMSDWYGAKIWHQECDESINVPCKPTQQNETSTTNN